jgi:hypothetical protein
MSTVRHRRRFDHHSRFDCHRRFEMAQTNFNEFMEGSGLCTSFF